MEEKFDKLQNKVQDMFNQMNLFKESIENKVRLLSKDLDLIRMKQSNLESNLLLNPKSLLSYQPINFRTKLNSKEHAQINTEEQNLENENKRTKIDLQDLDRFSLPSNKTKTEIMEINYEELNSKNSYTRTCFSDPYLRSYCLQDR